MDKSAKDHASMLSHYPESIKSLKYVRSRETWSDDYFRKIILAKGQKDKREVRDD